jgi:hypothetical protein
MKFVFSLSFLVAPLTLLLAGESVSNADLSRKLDLILGKVGGLEQRVSQLETENKEVKQAAKSATNSLQIPQDEKEKSSFFKKLKNQINSQEARDSGPWAKKESWSGIRKNLTRYQVRKALGDPHEVNQTLEPRIDQVYEYSGDLDADGKEEKGRVNFFRDRVVSFKTPFE